MADSDNQVRYVPENSIEYNLALINSEWGQKEAISQELLDKLQKIKGFYVDKDNKVIVDEEGNPEAVKEDLWSMLGFYTRDMRLSNLDNAQFRYCVFYLDLANDLLRVDMIEPFLVCLSRVVTCLELSQSRGGFLRKQQNTFTTESKTTSAEAGSRSLLTGKTINKEGGG